MQPRVKNPHDADECTVHFPEPNPNGSGPNAEGEIRVRGGPPERNGAGSTPAHVILNP